MTRLSTQFHFFFCGIPFQDLGTCLQWWVDESLCGDQREKDVHHAVVAVLIQNPTELIGLGGASDLMLESFALTLCPTTNRYSELVLRSLQICRTQVEASTIGRAHEASALSSLSRHPEPRERLFVARHPATDGNTLLGLASDVDAEIRAIAGQRIDRSPLAMLVTDSSWRVRRTIGWRLDAGAEILTILAGDASEKVRFEVASNRSTPREILNALSLDPVDSVVAAAAATLGRLSSDREPSPYFDPFRRFLHCSFETAGEAMFECGGLLHGLNDDVDLDPELLPFTQIQIDRLHEFKLRNQHQVSDRGRHRVNVELKTVRALIMGAFAPLSPWWSISFR